MQQYLYKHEEPLYFQNLTQSAGVDKIIFIRKLADPCFDQPSLFPVGKEEIYKIIKNIILYMY